MKPPAPRATGSVEIYRDAHGVPHIFAATRAGAYYGLGYAAAQDRPRTLPLHQAALQGRLAERLGNRPMPDPSLSFLDGLCNTPFFRGYGESAFPLDDLVCVDRWMRLFGYHERAQSAFGRLSDHTATAVEAYATGVNAYYDVHGAPDGFEPYEAATEIAWWTWFEHTIAMAFFISNAFAAGPDRTAGGGVLLGSDPHYWCLDGHSEAHVVAHDEDFELSGVWDGHVNIGFWGGTNGHIAIGITAGGMEGATAYRERLNPENRDEYWDWRAAGWRPLESRRHVVAQAGGEPTVFVARATHHGPIVSERLEDGLPVAYTVRSMYLEEPADALDQMVSMWSVRTAPDYVKAAADAPYVRGHRIVGDRAGNLAYASNGPVRVRSEAVDWSKPVDGSAPETEWSPERWRVGAAEHGLPAFVNPRGGFIQAANDPPWLATVPPEVGEAFPRYLYPEGWRELNVRGVRQRLVLAATDSLTPAEAEGLVFDSEVPHAKYGLAALNAELERHDDLRDRLSPDAARLVELLSTWDGVASRESTPMTVALHVHRSLDGGIPAPVIAPTTDPVRSPEIQPPAVGRQDCERYVLGLERTAMTLRQLYGTLEQPWERVHVFTRGEHQVGVPGGCNALRALFGAFRGWWDEPDALDESGVEQCNFGSRSLRVTELKPDGVRVWSLSVLGQVPVEEDASSPHVLDQLKLYAAQELKAFPLAFGDVRAAADPADHEHCNHRAREVLELPDALRS